MDTTSKPAVQNDLLPALALHPMQQKMLDQYLAFMRGITGLEYAILMPNGEVITHGNVTAKVGKVKKPYVTKNGTPRRRSIFPVGELSTWLKTNGFLDLKPGGLMDMPIGKFPLNSVQSMISNLARETWGAKSVTTQRGDGYVTVVRAY